MGIRREVATVSGLPELKAGLEALRYRVQNKVVRKALEAAAVPITAAATANALRHRRQAEVRGYKDKDTLQLNRTIGTRVKTYRRGGTLFLAAGPLYKMGGYHGHLVEFGHRIVKGGTLAEGGHTPGMSAAGKLWLRKVGLRAERESVESLSRNKKRGKRKWVTKWRYRAEGVPGFNLPRMHMRFGQDYDPEDLARRYEVRLRGGGRVIRKGFFGRAARTKAYPYMAPAFAATKAAALSIFLEECKRGIDEAAKDAKNLAVNARPSQSSATRRARGTVL